MPGFPGIAQMGIEHHGQIAHYQPPAGTQIQPVFVAADQAVLDKGGQGLQLRLEVVEKVLGRYQAVGLPGLPRFTGGAMGFVGYEFIHDVEPVVPRPPKDELEEMNKEPEFGYLFIELQEEMKREK